MAVHALDVERASGLTAVALSAGRRQGARLSSGPRRGFRLSPGLAFVQVPYPPLAPGWTRHTLTCGIALQCAPSKDEAAALPLAEFAPRQLAELQVSEGQAALDWAVDSWPGLEAEFRRHLPGLVAVPHPLLGGLPAGAPASRGLAAAARRAYARMPWTSRRSDTYRPYSVPVGGDGGVPSPNLPPPSRPEDSEDSEDEVRPGRRAGIPYPEWNGWTRRFLPGHVVVLERSVVPGRSQPGTGQERLSVPDEGLWFARFTDREMSGRLEDGADLDIDAYVAHYTDTMAGEAAEARVFRDLLPRVRDVTTALLLDGSASLGVRQGSVFRLELACADALSRAMTAARERHGVFTFSGNTRHRVEVRCLKDFADRRLVVPGGLGLTAGGYTRLGAPLRHLTARLLGQPSRRRLLIVIGDGLASDEGYEGRYAWADVAHAVTEAEEAGVVPYYIGVGSVGVDPLPEMFGRRRSVRIRSVTELPRILDRVHRELIAS